MSLIYPECCRIRSFICWAVRGWLLAIPVLARWRLWACRTLFSGLPTSPVSLLSMRIWNFCVAGLISSCLFFRVCFFFLGCVRISELHYSLWILAVFGSLEFLIFGSQDYQLNCHWLLSAMHLICSRLRFRSSCMLATSASWSLMLLEALVHYQLLCGIFCYIEWRDWRRFVSYHWHWVVIFNESSCSLRLDPFVLGWSPVVAFQRITLQTLSSLVQTFSWPSD